MSHLKAISVKYPVDVLWGNKVSTLTTITKQKHTKEKKQSEYLYFKKVIEARPTGVNKGAAARRLITENNPDFILCIGDDKTGMKQCEDERRRGTRGARAVRGERGEGGERGE